MKMEVNRKMEYSIISVRDNPMYMERAIDYFQSKWGIGREIYADCIAHSMDTPSPLPRWYLLIKEGGVGTIAGCFGLITNDFNSRQDLWPWLCALYVEETERGQALGGQMLAHAKSEAKNLGFGKLYLATDHVGYYEKYGFSHIGQCYGPGDVSRLYSSKT
jgi:N-acetylglutamate synthase-like GNAT family acetyltransferase